MKKIISGLLAAGLLCLAFTAHAQMNLLTGAGGKFKATTASGCAEATTFLARTSGLSGTETSAYTTMICGMVTDGVWSKLDALYIFATNSTTTANLNLKSTSFTVTETTGTNSPTFTTDQGYTAASSAQKVLDTALIPSAGGLNYTLNSAGIGVYVRNNRTTNANTYIIGMTNGNAVQLQLLNGGLTTSDLNDSAFPQTANTTTQGSWFLSRTAASGAAAMVLYQNGSAFGTYTSASASIPATCGIYILARSQTGSCTVGGQAVSDQVAAAWIGGGFNATEVSNFSARLNAYMTAVGANVY